MTKTKKPNRCRGKKIDSRRIQANAKNNGNAMRKRRPAEVSGGTLSTAILMPSQVVPQLMQTIRKSNAVTKPVNRAVFPPFIVTEIDMLSISQ
ncbi:hypothetical protein BN2475_450095 [Paraburkholderia ribeironis]|uniref:Uncharacterized protein n=1 Tax=Paraburkholderia ribeironis TaxID=1247936 RepID=A0A1N7SA38_9BURK|nr:hypothetical protein BN2475_450095 [Paraburkholderia ribeironis]